VYLILAMYGKVAPSKGPFRIAFVFTFNHHCFFAETIVPTVLFCMDDTSLGLFFHRSTAAGQDGQKKYIRPPGRFQPVSRHVEYDFCASEAQPLRFPSPADILKTAGNGGNL
jgi:hypothetical protein